MKMMEMLSEIIAIFSRWNKKLLRQPILIFFNLIQPLVWFLLFTQAFSAIGSIPSFQLLTGTSSYITFFTAAVIIQTIASSALNTGIGLVNDFDSGFMDKMRVAPINKSSILFGRLFSSALTTVIQVAIILVIGLALGVNIASGIVGATRNFHFSCLVRNCLVRHILVCSFKYKERRNNTLSWLVNDVSTAILVCISNANRSTAKLGTTSSKR